MYSVFRYEFILCTCFKSMSSMIWIITFLTHFYICESTAVTSIQPNYNEGCTFHLIFIPCDNMAST